MTVPPTIDLALRRKMADILLDMARIRHASDRRIDALLQEHALDITPAQANVLMTLIQHREPMTARQLARDLRLSEVTVGRFIRSMVAKGWVHRTRDPSDSRALLVEPTPKARDALPRFIAVSNTLQDIGFHGFDSERIDALARATRQILDHLSG